MKTYYLSNMSCEYSMSSVCVSYVTQGMISMSEICFNRPSMTEFNNLLNKDKQFVVFFPVIAVDSQVHLISHQ